MNNHDSKHPSPDDASSKVPPKDEAITRLLLGEVDATERAALETLIANDPAAQVAFEERRAAIELLRSTAIADEAPRLSTDRRAGIFAASAEVGGEAIEDETGGASVMPMTSARHEPAWLSYSGVAAAFLLLGLGFFFMTPREKERAPAYEFTGGAQAKNSTSEDLPERIVTTVEPDASVRDGLADRSGVISVEAHFASNGATTSAPSALDIVPGVPGGGAGGGGADAYVQVVPDPALADWDLWSHGIAHDGSELQFTTETPVMFSAQGDLKNRVALSELRISYLDASIAQNDPAVRSPIIESHAGFTNLGTTLRANGEIAAYWQEQAQLKGDGAADAIALVNRMQLDREELEEQIESVSLELARRQREGSDEELVTSPGRISPGAQASTRLEGGSSSMIDPAPPTESAANPLEQFPQVSGTLASVEAGFVVLDAGKQEGIQDGASFDLVDGDRVVARVKVLRAHDDLAACEVTTLEPGVELTSALKFRAVPDPAALRYLEKLEEERQAQLERERAAERQANEQRLRTLLSSCERLPEETPGQMYFRFWGDNPFVRADQDPLSTFGMDVDTASHAIVRKYLSEGRLPPRAAVRTEEFVNAYPSRLPPPVEQDLGITLEMADSVFSGREGIALLKVGIKAREVSAAERKPLSLTFVIDTSGSMGGGGRLELVKQAILTLLPELDDRDTIGIVAFSSTGRVVLEPVSALEVDAIGAALLTMKPDGSTNAQQGLDLGYAMAERQFRTGASNRVALFSDGVANTGITDLESLLARTAEARGRGIDFNSFGVGMGNHNDALLEQLADRGDGMCVYLDTLKEAQKYFREQLTGTFQTVARDAKIQVEFHPGSVLSYRQIGYENRAIADKDFRNDAVDAGEVGAGHEVVALYEVELKPTLDGPIATARVRYRSADHDEVVEIEKVATDAHLNPFLTTGDHFRLSATVAAFAEILRASTWARRTTLAEVETVARQLVFLDEREEGTPVADLLVMIEQSKHLVAKRILSDLDRLLDEVKRNQHLRARIEDRLGEEPAGVQATGVVKPAVGTELQAELDRLRAQHDELEERLRKLLVG